jgi:hypothetical protein
MPVAFRVAFVLIWTLAVFYAGRNWAIKRDISGYAERVDTLVVRDTIVQEKPVYRTISQVRTEYVPVCDTIRIQDTLFVPVPIETKVYEDSLYRAEVSGYLASLDRLEIYQQERIITQTIPVQVRERKRWGIGVQAGYGVSIPNGKPVLSPYIGIGVSYDLIRW